MHHRLTASLSRSAKQISCSSARQLQTRQPQTLQLQQLFRRSTISRLRWLSFVLTGMLIGLSSTTVEAAQPTPAGSVSPEVITAQEPVTPDPTAQDADQNTDAASDAPSELLQTLSQLDAAASQGNLQAVLAFYSPEFTNSDGMTYTELENSLKELWQRFPNLTYQTEINSWEQDGEAIVIETTTSIKGQQSNEGRPETLTATITSRQRLEAGKIVSQEILAEASQLSQGENPPTLEVNLPEQVTTGETFPFDAIVQEPLGDRILLGAALEEPIEPRGYFNGVPISLEVLNSGGLFKVGQAPAAPGNRWISAVIIRDDGITTITRRLQIVSPENAATP